MKDGIIKVVVIVALIWAAGKSCSQGCSQHIPRQATVEEYDAIMTARHGTAYRPLRSRQTSVATPAAPQHAQRPQSSVPAPTPARISASDHVIRAWLDYAASVFKIPEVQLLAGILTIESGRSVGAPSGKHLRPASEWVRGECTAKYDREKCEMHYAALVRICRQRRNGVPICDARTIPTWYALALGPTQHLPGYIISADKSGWGERAVDLDRDGVVDPNTLPDAIGMTAKLLMLNRHHRLCRQEAEPWRCAVEVYAGGPKGRLAARRKRYYERVIAEGYAYCGASSSCRKKPTTIASRR